MAVQAGDDPPYEQMRQVGGAELSRLIGASHLSWHFDAALTRRLKAAVAVRSVGALRLAWVRSNQWGGQRTSADIRSNPEPYLTIIMPLQGTMLLRHGDTETAIARHELGVWDSTQPIAFEINDASFEQLSVLVPQRLLRTLPRACRELHCARVDRSNVLSELCVQHMATLTRFLDAELRPYELSLSSVTTSLFDAVFATLYKGPRDKRRLLDDILNYIESYIAEDGLSAATIAEAFEISPRYVHKLFKAQKATVSEWIIERRLERSTDDLLRRDSSVTEIAFKWGFKDLGHYSRAFRRRYGVPPSRYVAAAASDV